MKKGTSRQEKYFVDGTKIESAANKYTFVWKGSVEKYEKKLDEKVRELIKEINTIAEQENEIYGDKDLEELGEGAEVTSEEIKAVAQKINNKLEALAENSERKATTVKKKLEKAKKELEKELLPRKEKYEGYNATFNGRNELSEKSVIKQNFLDRVCPKNCVNGYVRISRLEPVCQIVWQIDICCKKFLLEVKL